MPSPRPVSVRETAAVRTALGRMPRPSAGVPEVPKTLRHIAIIPDGNRRWATARGLLLWDGVREGVKTAESTFEAIRQRGVPWCTFWASSYDNLTERPLPERAVLNELFATWFSRLAENETVHREHVRVRVLGEWENLLSAPARAAIGRVHEATASCDGPSLTFLVGYDGNRELVAATNALLRERESVERGRVQAVTIADLRKHAWTQDLPEVDLLVRTGSWEDPHRSANFLPLLTSNVQEAYPQVFWPDFAETALDAVIADFAARGRRLGR